MLKNMSIQRIIPCVKIDMFNNLAALIRSGQLGKLATSPLLATSWELHNSSSSSGLLPVSVVVDRVILQVIFLFSVSTKHNSMKM